MTVILNGVEFSPYFNTYGLSPGTQKIEGPNSGTAMDGSAIVDLLKAKDNFELEGNYLPQGMYSQLVQICKNAYITVVIDNPNTGEARATKIMIPTLSHARQVPMRGQMYYTDFTLTLVDK